MQTLSLTCLLLCTESGDISPMSDFFWYFSTAIILAFLNPSFEWVERRIFFYDLWVGISPALLLFAYFRKKGPSDLEQRMLILWFLSGGLLLFYYLHGMLRPDLQYELEAVGVVASQNHVSTEFSWANDTISFWRFWTWLSQAFFAWFVVRSRTPGDKWKLIARTGELIFFCSIFVAVLSGLFYFLPSLRAQAGQLWGYDPESQAWSNRFHGTFGSPVELSAALFLGWIWGFSELITHKFSWKRFTGLLVIAFGLWGGNTLNPILGAILGTGGIVYLKWRAGSTQSQKTRFVKIGLSVSAGFLILLTVGLVTSGELRWFFQWKFNNFMFRVGPWRVFVDALLTRWDFLLFGFGFSRGHSDSSWIAALKTGGLSAGLILAKVWINILKKVKHTEIFEQKLHFAGLALGFFAIGIFSDSYFFRSAGSLGWITLTMHLTQAGE